jgi:hypothetical protein
MNFLVNPIIHPLFQILITFVLCSGILNFGKIINNIVIKDYNYDYNFFNLAIGSIILAHIILILFLTEILNLVIIPITTCLILLGIVNIKFFTEISQFYKKLFKNDNKLFTIIFIFFAIFFIISLGPPSMSDALDYHYGVPLNIIKFSNFPDHNTWLHGTLFGYAELINIIPLNLKTDNFFSFFQLLSLVYFFEYFYKKKIDYDKLLYSILFVICTPVILFLISGPKALLFPQLLTTMALYLYVKDNNYNRKNIIVISILLIGATQFKLSFILSGAVLGFLILIKTFKNDKTNILILISLLLLIFLPRIFYNFSQVTSFTFINIFTTSPMYFLEYLHNYEDNDYIYPINLFIPSSIGMVSTILGFHLLLLFFLKKLSYKFKLILIITFLSIIIHFIFGQQTSRLYFEFVLWISVGFYFLEKKSFNIKYFNYALLPQLIFIFVSSLYFSIMCIPTFFSLEKRDQFMKKNSYDYSAIKWVNNNVPNNATILSELRSISLYNNKTIPYDKYLNNYDISEERINYLKLNKPQFFITTSNNLENFYLKGCIGDLYKASKEITIAKRNPFNKNTKFNVYIYHFNYENLNFCVNLKQ